MESWFGERIGGAFLEDMVTAVARLNALLAVAKEELTAMCSLSLQIGGGILCGEEFFVFVMVVDREGRSMFLWVPCAFSDFAFFACLSFVVRPFYFPIIEH